MLRFEQNDKRPAPRPKARARHLAMLGVVCLFGMASCGSTTTRTHSAPAARTQTTGSAMTSIETPSMDTGRLAEFVRDFNAADGNDVQSASAVPSSRKKFFELVGDTDDAQETAQDVVILQVRGTFPVVLEEPEIVDGKAVSPTTRRTAVSITTVFNADLTQTLDVATQYEGNAIIDLDALGSPVSDIPIR